LHLQCFHTNLQVAKFKVKFTIYMRERERERERKRKEAIRTYDAHVTPVLDRAYTNVVMLSNVILTTPSRAFSELLMLCTAKLAD